MRLYTTHSCPLFLFWFVFWVHRAPILGFKLWPLALTLTGLSIYTQTVHIFIYSTPPYTWNGQLVICLLYLEPQIATLISSLVSSVPYYTTESVLAVIPWSSVTRTKSPIWASVKQGSIKLIAEVLLLLYEWIMLFSSITITSLPTLKNALLMQRLSLYLS